MQILAFIFTISLLTTNILLGEEDTAAVVAVDGAAITQQEITFSLAPFRGELTRMKEMPAEEAKIAIREILQRVIERAIDAKLQLLDAASFQIITSTAYSSVRSAWKQENIVRSTARAENKIIYGPVEFSEPAFFEYYLSHIIIQLKDTLARRTFDVSEKRLQAFYDSVRGAMFRKHDRMTLLHVIATTSAKDKLDALRKEVGKVNDPATLEARYQCEAAVLTIDDERYRLLSEERETLLRAAMELRIGEMTPWLSEDKELFLLKCLGREPSGFMPFEEARGIIRSKMIDADYAQRLRSRRSHARIVINEAAVGKLVGEVMSSSKSGASQTNVKVDQ